MSLNQKIRLLVNEAKLYKEQGLLTESKRKYMEAIEIIKNNKGSLNTENLISGIQKWIQDVEKAITDIEEATSSPTLTNEVQELIRNSFSFSSNAEIAAIEGALALAQFGQHERALTEFHRLMDEGILPFASARNIIKCLIALSLPDAALAQYRQWVSRGTLPVEELEYIRTFLEDALESGENRRNWLLKNKPIKSAIDNIEDKGDPILEISSVTLRLQEGPFRGRVVDCQVTFQSGNVISAVIPSHYGDISEAFAPGISFSCLECYSKKALLRCRGMIFGKTKISNGLDKGGYLLDITLDVRDVCGAASS